MNRLHYLLVLVAALSIGWAGLRTRRSVERYAGSVAPAPTELPQNLVRSPAGHATWERNPFRTSSAANSTARAQDSLPASTLLRDDPEFEVRAIAGGPPWRAVVARVTGVASDVVVAPGDTVGGFVVGAIDSASVVLTGGSKRYTLWLPHARPPED